METRTKDILLVIAVVAIVVLIYHMNKKGVVSENGLTCFDLPSDADPAVFGPKYWAAFHSLAHHIPCEGCRGFAEKFMVFFHDVVNKKLGKPIYDRDNYNRILLELNMPTPQ